MPQKNRQESKIFFSTMLLILSVILVATLARASLFNTIYTQTPNSVVRGDTNRYEDPAINLLTHGTLAIDPTSPRTTTLSTTPIYSLFIAATYKVFGLQNRSALIITQILLSALTILITFFIAHQLWSREVALIATTLMALDPLQTLYSQIILSETLFTFFFVFSIFTLTKLLTTENKMKWALALGVMITLTTMTKPISYYLVFCFILGFIFFKQRVAKSWLQLLSITLLILTPLLLVTTAWKVRNANLTGVYVLNDAMSETMLYYKAKGVLITKKSLTDKEAQQEILKRLPQNIKTPKEQVDAESKLAKEIILNDLSSYLKLSVNGLKAIIFGPGLTSQAQFYDNKEEGRTSSGYKPWYLFLISYSILFILTTYCLSVYGFIRSIIKSTKQKNVLHLLLLGTVFYFILISTGHIASDSRMRVPIIPIILLYAAYGAYSLLETLRRINMKKTKA